MTKEELAATLNGRQYRAEMTNSDAEAAKSAGLVVVFGASDDLMEFRGAVDDEVGAYDGGTAYFTRDGLLANDCDNEDCPHFAKARSKATEVNALWCETEDDGSGAIPWTFETTIPHATFEIMEDDELFCRGIVFALADVPA